MAGTYSSTYIVLTDSMTAFAAALLILVFYAYKKIATKSISNSLRNIAHISAFVALDMLLPA